jgi:hypothetical protein
MIELKPPPAAQNASEAAEVLRAWIIDKGLHCSLSAGAFGGGENEVIVWAVLLSDVARHVADALHHAEGLDPQDTLKKMLSHFTFEINTPTADTNGEFEKQ